MPRKQHVVALLPGERERKSPGHSSSPPASPHAPWCRAYVSCEGRRSPGGAGSGGRPNREARTW